MRRLLLVIVAGTGCAGEPAVLSPLVEAPPAASAAHPYEGLDELELSVARAGDDVPLALASAPVGVPLELSDIPFGSDLVVHLSGKAAGVEIAYGRTCAIDVPADASADADLWQPRLYFSRIVRWGETAAVPAVPTRRGGHGYALPDGSAAFVGGDSDRIEVFDPLGAGGFSQLAPRALVRQGAVLVPLGGDDGSGGGGAALSGAALIVGGTDAAGDAVAEVEIIDPGAQSAGRQREAFAGPPLVGHAGVRLVDGSVIVAGGQTQAQDGGGAFEVTGDAWQLRIGAGGVLEAPVRLGEPMTTARAQHTMTRLGNEVGADVLVVGGLDASGAPVAQAELYRPLREAFEVIEGAVLARPRWDHAAVRMPGGFVLVLGGLVSDDGAGGAGGAPVPEASMELYDPVQGSFAPAGTLPAGAGLTDMTVTPLPDGRVLLAGGRDAAGQPVATVLIARLDPIDGQVDISPSSSLGRPRAGHSAVSLCDGTILVVGGTDDAAAPAERYNPPSAGRR